ncbi:MAG: sigma-70 family RNA polymerase sigma factor [Phycisphaerae bacterium]|jgi:RNA polymerase sigma factor (sigma-70 family)|nr:sigma-70 family RNA polymerase sigma factor [Phycisphaerae bacterium]
MSATTATSTELLNALFDPEAGAWGAFVGRYRPLIESFAERCGLSSEEARDVAQSVLLEFYRSYSEGKYQRDRGRLRDWLFGIARHRVGRLRRDPERRLLSLTEDAESGPSDVGSLWEAAWQRELLLAALARVKADVDPATFEAFELFALAGVPSKAVAESLGITENAVYGAKRRIMTRLREVRSELENLY